MLIWKFKRPWIGALLALSLAGGCGREEAADTRAAQSGDGVIEGRVIFSGAADGNEIDPRLARDHR